MDISQPHDKYFKEQMKIKENALDVIKNTLPEELINNLQLNKLELDKTSYINAELEETFSDIVYNCIYKNKKKIKISLLFEHKSYVPDYPQIQLLKYMIGIWDINIAQKKELSIVVPIIFYHGKDSWIIKRFYNYFEGIDETLKKYIPDFKYILTDLSKYSNEEIKNKIFENVFVKMFALMMKNINDKEELERILKDILEIGKIYYNEEKGLNFLKSTLLYLFSTTEIEMKKVEEILKSITNKGGDIIMTTAKMLEEKGIEKGIKDTVIRMMGKNLDDETIAEFSGLTVNEIKRIRKEISTKNAIRG